VREAVGELLEATSEPAPPEQRYKLLTGAHLRNLSALARRVRGVVPSVGLAALYGPSASGRSFLGFDMAAAMAEGRRWFECRVETAPVLHAALEGEAAPGWKSKDCPGRSAPHVQAVRPEWQAGCPAAGAVP
jgi:putative DNA primase/helicase